jgi:predicted GH43/DUF377 family glycosyl hydrolase
MFSVRRNPADPFITPDLQVPWRAIGAFNPSPTRLGDTRYVLYRAATEPALFAGVTLELSTVAIAKSDGDEPFGHHRQLIIPEEEWEKYGCEDPRVTKIDDTYYVFYTALSLYPFTAEGIKVAVAITKDLHTIDEKHLVTPFNAKAMTMLPERINGKLCAILTVHSDLPPSRTAIAFFDKPEDIWSTEYWNKWYANLDEHTINLRHKDSDHVEVGAAPIKTDQGWLLVYSHIQDYFVENHTFGIEAALLDNDDPRKILAQTNFPFMVPETSYERYGRLPNIIFPSGVEREDDKLWIYYGATDTVCCRAELNLNALLNSMSADGSVRQHVKRYEGNPILSPIPEHNWEAYHVLNPAAIDIADDVHILYRAVGPLNTSVIGYARSHDGLHIDERLPLPIYSPRASFEQKHAGPMENSGCEDARIVRVDDKLIITYTAYDSVVAPRVASSSISVDDFLAHNWDAWSEPNLISPDGIDDKDACVIPEKINDKYMLLHRIDHHVCADFVEDLDFAAHKITRCIQIFGPRRGMWDSNKVGIAGPPIKTDAGWILFYHGITVEGHYCLGAVLLDPEDPTQVIGRTSQPIMSPVERWEREGWIGEVVFPCGQVVRDGLVYLYYGGADHVVGVATITIDELIESLVI